MWFLVYTNYTAEDAYITFQFSRNLAIGNGFAINPGYPIYGSTTPLLTFILAIWYRTGLGIVLGARIIDMMAVVGGMIFLYAALPDKRAAIIALFVMAVSSRLFVEEMQGMEMPLLFLFAAGSYYGYVKKNPVLAGLFSGLILWTRVDAVFWVGCLFMVFALENWRSAIGYSLTVCAIYAPWIIFSWLYFGSPIPFTIVAKQVAYGIGSPPYPEHFQRIVSYIGWSAIGVSILGFFTARRDARYWIFPCFVIIETVQLILTGATFFNRYFYLLTIALYIGVGIGIAELYNVLPIKRLFTTVVLTAVLCASSADILDSAKYRSMQSVRNTILTETGTWINGNSRPGATVLLEPLGYVGWYADRTMIDEVGLVTPLVVQLKRQGVPARDYYRVFWPDYVIWTCGEGGPERAEIGVYYDLARVFDGHISRTCYEIWKLRSYHA